MRSPASSRPYPTRPTISQATWTIATLLQCIAIQNTVAQNKANTWEIVGETGVSAMQLFRGKGNKVSRSDVSMVAHRWLIYMRGALTSSYDMMYVGIHS